MRKRVLLIDDSSVSLLVAEALLIEEGYDVRTASTLDEFSQHVADWSPEVILADVQMPGITGPELCRALKDKPETAHVPVLLYSSLPKAELAKLAQQCGADGYVCKANRHQDLPRQLAELWPLAPRG